MKNTLIRLFLFFINQIVFGQLEGDFEKYKAEYPNEDRVRIQVESTIYLRLVKGEIEIIAERIDKDIYLNDNANRYSKEHVSYSSFYEVNKIKASSFSLNNGKYQEFKVKDFNEDDNIEGGSFYDDNKKIRFIYSQLKKGSITRLSYSEKIKNPRFLNSFFFGDYAPVKFAKLTIVVGKGIKLKFNELNFERHNIQSNVVEKGDKKTYTWITENVAKFEDETGAVDIRNSIPHIIPFIASYEVDGKETDVLKNTRSLYNWYYELIKTINTDIHDPELVVLVDTLTKGLKTDLEKVEAIYCWAQQNIKYVAFEYALGGFVPRNANSIFKKNTNEP